MAQFELFKLFGPLLLGILVGVFLVKFAMKYRVNPVVLGMKFMYTVMSNTKRMLIMAEDSKISDDDAEELALLISVNIVDQIMDGFDGTISPRLQTTVVTLVGSGVITHHTVESAIMQAYSTVETKILKADRQRLSDASRIVTRAITRVLGEDINNEKVS